MNKEEQKVFLEDDPYYGMDNINQCIESLEKLEFTLKLVAVAISSAVVFLGALFIVKKGKTN